ncbi:SatD family protein [Coraliomargarita parva]|uniref:SatD family protein n=1 Tax=Coraliomargarita parva TaxID=3014050 RepID=UPI0022B55558|nr:SatD family protein [Coraliomargarita parva]
MTHQQTRYAVVIGDLIESKAIRKRDELQVRLQQGLERLSLNPSLASPYTITLGDEFQAVFHSGKGLFHSIFAIRELIAPASCRFAIGIGALSTAINPTQAIGMDGPAFHSAREQIEKMKHADEQLSMGGLARPMQAMVSPLIRLLWSSTSHWNRNRLKILLGLLEGQTEKELGNTLAITERAVYKNIRDAHLHDWKELIETVESRISQVLSL